MDYLIAFLVGGAICAAGQMIMDFTKLTPAHMMVLFVVMGGVFTALGLYEPLVKWAGAGASIPVSNFGFVLTKGVIQELNARGPVGLLTGVFELAGAAIAASVFLGFLMALIFNPKG